MMTTEVRGLVIRTTDVKEADRIITIFTEEMGAVSAVARGARSHKSRKMSSTMQFCYGNFVLYKQGEYFHVKEAELIESFYGLRNSLDGLALASYIAEVLNEVAVAEAERDLLRLSLNSLYAISEGKYSLEKVKAAFEIRAASIIGFMPDVSGCAECGKSTGDFFLDVMNGIILCSDCRKKEEENHSFTEEDFEHAHIICVLNDGARHAMNYVLNCPTERILSFRLTDEEDMRLFSIAAETYFLNQVEHGFATLQFYKDIIRMKRV